MLLEELAVGTDKNFNVRGKPFGERVAGHWNKRVVTNFLKASDEVRGELESAAGFVDVRAAPAGGSDLDAADVNMRLPKHNVVLRSRGHITSKTGSFNMGVLC